MRKGLSATKLGVRRADGPGDSKYLAVAFKHGECYVLVGEPPKRGKRNHSFRADHDQPTNAMPDTRKTSMTARRADPILDQQMTAIHSGLNAISDQSHDPALGCNRVWRFCISLGHDFRCRTLHISLYINDIRKI